MFKLIVFMFAMTVAAVSAKPAFITGYPSYGSPYSSSYGYPSYYPSYTGMGYSPLGYLGMGYSGLGAYTGYPSYAGLAGLLGGYSSPYKYYK